MNNNNNKGTIFKVDKKVPCCFFVFPLLKTILSSSWKLKSNTWQCFTCDTNNPIILLACYFNSLESANGRKKSECCVLTSNNHSFSKSRRACSNHHLFSKSRPALGPVYLLESSFFLESEFREKWIPEKWIPGKYFPIFGSVMENKLENTFQCLVMSWKISWKITY